MKRYLQSTCPFCGHRMLVTSHGYKCECCTFVFPQFVCNRHISEKEACDVINGKRTVLDGFATNDGRSFSSILVIEGHRVLADNTVCYCQRISGNGRIIVKNGNFICKRKSSCPHSNCKFPFRRWYNTYELTVSDVNALATVGRIEFPAVNGEGEIYTATLSNIFSIEKKIGADKSVI